MAKTRHINQRMNQRGITESMLQIVQDHGISYGDKQVLNRDNIDRLVSSMDCLRKKLLKIRDKGGLVVVESNGIAITAYRTDSFKRCKGTS